MAALYCPEGAGRPWCGAPGTCAADADMIFARGDYAGDAESRGAGE